MVLANGQGAGEDDLLREGYGFIVSIFSVLVNFLSCQQVKTWSHDKNMFKSSNLMNVLESDFCELVAKSKPMV